MIRNPQLGDKVAATLGDRHRCLLRGHGGTVVAADLDTLFRGGIDVVRSAKIQLMAAPLGPLKTHSLEECEQMAAGREQANASRRHVDFYFSEVFD